MSRGSLSSFWRRRKSTNPAEELLHIKKAAQNYVGFFGSDFRVVTDSSVPRIDYGTKTVNINFAPLEGQKAPFDGPLVDLVMAEVLHEGSHAKWSYDPGLIGQRCRDYWEREARRMVANVLEDFYIEDKLSRAFPALGRYLDAYRQYLRPPPDALKGLATGDVTQRDMFILWGAVALSGVDPPDMDAKTAKMLGKLLKMTVGQTDDPKQRIRRAGQAYKLISQLPATPQSTPPGSGQSQRESGEDSEKQREDSRSDSESTAEDAAETGKPTTDAGEKTAGETEEMEIPDFLKNRKPTSIRETPFSPVPDELVKEMDRLDEEASNITSLVQGQLPSSEAVDIHWQTAPDSSDKLQEYSRMARPLVPALRQLFQREKQSRTRHRRGLLDGKVDSHRLPRAGIPDFRVFRRRELLQRADMVIGILADVSGSMMSRGLKQVMTMARALQMALATVEGIKLLVAGYEGGAYVTLSTVSDGLKFHAGLDTGGSTPSGEAMAAMAIRMRQRWPGKEHLIVHLTDGEPNAGQSVKEALNFCRDKSVEVMTVSVGIPAEYLMKDYDGLVRDAKDVDELPAMLRELLQERLKRMGKGQKRSWATP